MRPKGWPQLPFRACEKKQGDFRVIEVADADLVVGRQQIEGRAHASKIVGARDT